MGALDKLINLLEQVKETNPDFTEKAEQALDVLVGEDGPLDETEDAETHAEPFDDSYVEIEGEDLEQVVLLQKKTSTLITSLGLLTQNYEVDKEECLEEMETTQKKLQGLMEDLKGKYNLDRGANYTLLFPSENTENPEVAAFKKQ
jgi:hypothetical protein